LLTLFHVTSPTNPIVLVCSHFELEKFEKGPKEIFDPDIQKDILVLEEQEVRESLIRSLLICDLYNSTGDYDCDLRFLHMGDYEIISAATVVSLL
jgi:hypothetical protein